MDINKIKHYLVVGGMLMPLLSVSANNLDFIDSKFDGFLDRVVQDKEDHDLFKRYYSKLNQKIQDSEEESRKSAYHYLHNLALKKLEGNQPEWHKAIKLSLEEHSNEERGNVDDRVMVSFFLTRFGAYQEFLKKKSMLVNNQTLSVQEDDAKADIWNTVKGYVKTAKTKLFKFGGKVTGWFNSSNEKVVSA